jgi:hypothetical protein
MFTNTTLKHMSLSAVLCAGLALSACGTTPGDRALSGGLIGAGTGAAIGSLSGSAGAGALIGGLGGAAIGALTAERPQRSAYRSHCVRYSSRTGRCLRRS